MKKLFSLIVLSLLLASCGKEESSPKPQQVEELPQISIDKTPVPVTPPQPKIKLEARQFKDLPNWKNDNLVEALSGFKHSCLKILKEKGPFLSDSELRIPTAAYQLACQRLINADISTAVEFKYFLESNFLPFLVIADGSDQGKFTSYYEAAINASPIQTGIYKFPIYGKPLDLIEFNPRDFDPSLPSKRLIGRVKDQKLIPYYTREEIEKNNISAPVILWVTAISTSTSCRFRVLPLPLCPTEEPFASAMPTITATRLKASAAFCLKKATSNPAKPPWAT